MSSIAPNFGGAISKILRIVFISMTAGFIFTGCGGSESTDKGGERLGEVKMPDYFPFRSDSYWAYSWNNIRGDAWTSSMSVVSSHTDQNLQVFIVADSTERYGQFIVHRSAYLWDGEGLKHLYRTITGGDCTTFLPPRLVLPFKISGAKPHGYDYRCQVFDPTGTLKYAVNIHQSQKLVEAGVPVEVGEGRWDDCVAVETMWSTTYTSGARETHRKAIWYARQVGPVRIVAGIPTRSPSLEGEETGVLVASHL